METFWVLTRSSDCVFTGSNCTRVWMSRRHVGRIKAFHSESDRAVLQWLLIKDRDTEPDRQTDGRKDRQTPQSWGLHTVKLSEERHCEKGNCQTSFFFYQHLKSDGWKMEFWIWRQSYQKISAPLITQSGHHHLLSSTEKYWRRVFLIWEKKIQKTEWKNRWRRALSLSDLSISLWQDVPSNPYPLLGLSLSLYRG